jgi:phospholipase/carboxylesterase
MIEQLRYLERPAAGDHEGALVLLHGRGADERDLFPLLDALDPERRLLGITPRGPLSLPPGGAHWYRLGGIPTPDPDTFFATFEAAAAFLDALPVPIERVVLGGFSQGAVMSWALGLCKGRPRPAAIIAMSGFMPEVDGFALDLSGLDGYPIAVAHGALDPVIPVAFGRAAAERVAAAGADLLWRETPVPHTIDPRLLPELQAFVVSALSTETPADTVRSSGREP